MVWSGQIHSCCLSCIPFCGFAISLFLGVLILGCASASILISLRSQGSGSPSRISPRPTTVFKSQVVLAKKFSCHVEPHAEKAILHGWVCSLSVMAGGQMSSVRCASSISAFVLPPPFREAAAPVIPPSASLPCGSLSGSGRKARNQKASG